MKLFKLAILISAVAVTVAACSQKASKPKALVLFYSQSGNTKVLAEEIAGRLGADIEQIVPAVPYSGTYQETIERAGRERELEILPEIESLKADISGYDLIFIGYPIWYGTYALPVATLLDKVDFSGKKIVPFCTFGSGGLVSSSRDMAKKLPDAEILPGFGIRSALLSEAPREVDRYLKESGFTEGEVQHLEPFPEVHPVTEDEAALFDKAVGDYPMIHAKATAVSSRAIPEGTEYQFKAVDIPREGAVNGFTPREMTIYVRVEEGKDPVFTQVVR